MAFGRKSNDRRLRNNPQRGKQCFCLCDNAPDMGCLNNYESDSDCFTNCSSACFWSNMEDGGGDYQAHCWGDGVCEDVDNYIPQDSEEMDIAVPWWPPGDLNGDGSWNVLDIVQLANCVLEDNCGG